MNDESERMAGAQRDKKNLFVRKNPTPQKFVSPPGGGNSQPPVIYDKLAHVKRLIGEYDRVWQQGETSWKMLGGAYATFQVEPSLDRSLNKLESLVGKERVELRSAKRVVDGSVEIIQANVFIPVSKREWFDKKLKHYRESDGEKNAALVDNIQSIVETSVEQLWTDPLELLPRGDGGRQWWEVWLSTVASEDPVNDFKQAGQSLGITVNSDAIQLNERAVVLAYGSLNEFEDLVKSQNAIAELRHPNELSVFMPNEAISAQREWSEEFLQRTSFATPDSPAVCILDQGVYRENPLLKDSLSQDSCFSAKNDRNFAHGHDPVSGDHGTEMAGLALFYDLARHVQTSDQLELKHRLESVKIIPNRGATDPQMYGAITAMAVSHPEISRPNQRRVFMLAVTARDGLNTAIKREARLPTSWSATIDALAFGREVDASDRSLVYLDRDEPKTPRLFVISVGNIDITTAEPSHDPYERCDLSPIEDPSHAWNAISVGAYSETDVIDPGDTPFAGYKAVSTMGDLSPVSRTGVLLGQLSPMKPDVVESGGNWAISPNDDALDKPKSFQQLTTRRSSHGRGVFTTTSDTSAATAKVAAIAADIMAAYPEYRAETVRGLLVHSAQWTTPMLEALNKASLSERVALVRRFGMGVPSLDRAVACAENSVNLIAEASIRPYDKGKAREVVWHELPWPRSKLLDQADGDFQMRVTLSYFIEPNPSSRGWGGRYSYQSHGLRFDTKLPEESSAEFHARVNRADRDEDYVPGVGSSSGWFLGKSQRKRNGSIHTDIWKGDAASLAEMGEIAVYPVSGWWKERTKLDQSDQGVNYSLIVSLETDQNIDLWTPIHNQISTPVQISS